MKQQIQKPQQSQLNLQIAIAFAVSLAARHLLTSLARDGFGWQAHDVAMHLNSFLLIGFIAALVWNRDAYSKYIAGAWLGYELISLSESIFTLFKMPRIENLMLWQIIGGFIFCIWVMTKESHRDKTDGEL